MRTPVWIAAGADRLYAFSAADAGKVKRIRATSRVRLAACDLRGAVRSGWREGRARVVPEQERIAAARRAFRAKYGFVMWLTDAMATLAGRIQRRAYLEILLADRTGSED